MPRKKRISKRRSVRGGLEEWQVFLLAHGPGAVIKRIPAALVVTLLADAGDLWTNHGAHIMRMWLTERPGSRPWAWWNVGQKAQVLDYSAPTWTDNPCPGMIWLPDPRRKLSGPEYEFERWPALVPTHNFGCFAVYGGGPVEYETEKQYLERHGLLLPEEIN